MKTRDPDHKGLTLSDGITRRDFVGTTLLGVGAALLHRPCPAASQDLGPTWTGYGGVGDYRFSNGNTAEVVSAAHKIRDRAYEGSNSRVIDTGEVYDVVIVGGGFAGISAQREFQKRHPDGKSLLLDNHAIFGGFAKSNEFNVDGYRIAGAQASINFLLPDSPNARGADYLRELGLPEQFQFARPEDVDPSVVFQKATSGPFYYGEQTATVGYYFQNSLTQGKGTWVKNIWDGDLQRAPLPETLKGELLALRVRWPQLKNDGSDAWLDRITFADLVTKVMGMSSEVMPYVMPILGVAGHSGKVSAYAAVGRIPGMERFPIDSANARMGDR
jgi:spermidine dehydrogenase